MNNMNRVFIEGKIIQSSIHDNGSEIYFDVKSLRFYKDNGKGVSETSITPIKIESNLYNVAKNKLDAGKTDVRVEGRLSSSEGLMIIAQFIEFKKDYASDEN